MADQWYIAKSGAHGAKQFGPFTRDQLQQLVSTGRLLPADLIWQEGTAGWVAAGTAGLFPLPTAVQARRRMANCAAPCFSNAR